MPTVIKKAIWGGEQGHHGKRGKAPSGQQPGGGVVAFCCEKPLIKRPTQLLEKESSSKQTGGIRSAVRAAAGEGIKFSIIPTGIH